MKYLLLVLLSFNAFAQVSHDRRLKKLSFHIRGISPSVEEYKALKLVSEEEISDFFNQKATEYLSSENHAIKMKDRLDQLFRLGLPEYIFDDVVYEDSNALGYLFKNIAKNNLSWNELLTSKSYELSKAEHEESSSNDFGFLGAVLPEDMRVNVRGGIINKLSPKEEVENDVEKNVTFEFPQSDVRIAGALTTSRFFGRYGNTGLNKNRRRAAAVFRIFMCDEMEAAIPESENNFDYVLDFVFPSTTGMKKSDIEIIAKREDRHGTQKDCMACHYKLDPMGRNFGGSGIALAPTAFPGALSYRDEAGDLVNIKTEGLGDLANAIVDQKQYKSCQTKRFWEWFIGEDKVLTESTHEELINKFDEVDGRTNDFISYIVSRKEFFETKVNDANLELVLNTKNILKNCNVCHIGMGLPDFTKWPIDGAGKDMAHWTKRIWKRLDLDRDGERRSMPPEHYAWQPSEEDLAVVKKWIEIGAPNELGKPQI